MIKPVVTLLLLCSTIFFSATSSADNNKLIKPFVAQYDLFRQGDKYGSGTRELTALGDDKYKVSLVSHIEWLIFSDDRSEQSEFFYNDGKITPHIYNFKRTGTGKDKKLNVNFQPDGNLVLTPRKKNSKVPEQWEDGWLDEMTLHLKVQQDLIQGKKHFVYDIISSSGKFKTYEMEVIGHEIISTGQGRYDAVKVARVYKKGSLTQMHAWFIPELNYTLSRLWRMRKGVEQYDLVLANYKQK